MGCGSYDRPFKILAAVAVKFLSQFHALYERNFNGLYEIHLHTWLNNY